MAPVTRRSTSAGIAKPPLRKVCLHTRASHLGRADSPSVTTANTLLKSKTRDDSFPGSGVGLATSALRADADAALQSRPESDKTLFAVKAHPSHGTMTNGSDAADNIHDALQPLSTMAERVGREVEDFAEKVDRWKTKLTKAGNDGSQKYKATMTLVDQLEGVAKDRLADYQKSKPDKHSRSTSRSKRSSLAGLRPEEIEAKIKDAQMEVDTWKLFRIALEFEFDDPASDREAHMRSYYEQRGDLKPYAPGGDVWERFLIENHLAREQNAILHWLEQSARSHGQTMDEILAQLEEKCGRGTSSYNRNWLHTQSRLKAEKRNRITGDAMDADALTDINSKDLISQLDPDAPTRQMRPLDAKDTDQERAVSEACFQMLRAGVEWGEITEWLNERGENWRAVSLGIACEEQAARTNVEGSDYGSLWRKVCYAVARNGDTPTHEKALYGLCAGDLPTSLSQCKSWDDHIYAHFNALILGHFHSWLRENASESLEQIDEEAFPSPTALEAMGEGYVGAEIVNSLKGNENTRGEALSPIKQVQGALIARQFIALAVAVGLAASNNLYTRRLEKSEMMPRAPVEVDPSFSSVFENETALRLLVHFSMIIEALRPGGENARRHHALDRVIICYLDFLRRAGKFETLPTYAVYMESDLADKVLGMMLADIVNPDEQRILINLIDRSGMKAVEALLEQVYFTLDNAKLGEKSNQPVLEYQLTEATGGLQWPGFRILAEHIPTELAVEEEKIIRAAEWYTLVDGQLYGILDLLAVIYRSFLGKSSSI